ncbi:hypothetical protein L7F22_042931 [Adiantum nelumboides]|nr:hypothetical protein [Adiantum nelumboides]
MTGLLHKTFLLPLLFGAAHLAFHDLANPTTPAVKDAAATKLHSYKLEHLHGAHDDEVKATFLPHLAAHSEQPLAIFSIAKHRSVLVHSSTAPTAYMTHPWFKPIEPGGLLKPAVQYAPTTKDAFIDVAPTQNPRMPSSLAGGMIKQQTVITLSLMLPRTHQLSVNFA